jgi:serine protease Do
MWLRNALLLLLCTLPAAAQPPDFLLRTQEVIAQVSEGIKPAVVHIEVWSRRGGQRVKGQGSGLVVAPDGTIVTNHHVVDKAEHILVVLDDKSRHQARVMRSDKQTDLAVLKIDVPRPLKHATLADSDDARVGQWVLAIGNPYGLDRTVSFGIISGKGRYMPGSESGVSPLNDFLQTDAMIDPGSSGGPLVNLQGKVLGINSSGIGRGIGFTIPAKVVQEVMQGKQSQGQLERGWLGMYTQALPRDLAQHLGMPEVHGVLVSDTAAGSPAQRAGLTSGDVITEFDGVPVEAEQEDEIQRFAQQVSRYAPGRRLVLTVRRGKQTLKLPAEVGLQPSLETGEVETAYGFTVAEVTPYRQQQYRLAERSGLVVTEVQDSSPAGEAGVEAGDLLLRVEEQPAERLSDVETRLSEARPGKSVLLRMKKGQYQFYVLLQQRGKKRPGS